MSLKGIKHNFLVEFNIFMIEHNGGITTSPNKIVSTYEYLNKSFLMTFHDWLLVTGQL